MSYKVKIEVDGYQCLRCGHKWVPRVLRGNELPTICPKCKSPYWNKERRQHLKQNVGTEASAKTVEEPAIRRVSQPRRS